MITTKYVRDNLEAIKASLQKRKSDYPLEELLKLDEEWRRLKTELQELQAKRNKASLEISESKKKGGNATEIIKSLQETKLKIEEVESELPSYEARISELLWNIPNILDESVKYGKDEGDNTEIKKWGETSKKSALSHSDILEKLGLVDIERAAKAAGARFYYLKGDLVHLGIALEKFALDELSKKGFVPVLPPYMLRKEHYMGVTSLGDFEDALYRVTGSEEAEKRKDYERVEDNLFLIATSEHAIAAMHTGELFSAKELPLKYVGVSPCFRREAGAHGKDTKGIFRVHQFEKVEQFIFCREEDSPMYFKELVANEEELFQKLGLPYHVVEMCTGEMGVVAAKKIDIEGWFPSQSRYRELTSASNCTDWQSRRLDIKYDEGGERKYVHTLNATGIAVERTLAAIVENYYDEKSGSIAVPEVLVPYMGKSRIG
ncbi:MAG: serine--tRNA ligase [Candidatus Micrarchaeaceae archaeon]